MNILFRPKRVENTEPKNNTDSLTEKSLSDIKKEISDIRSMITDIYDALTMPVQHRKTPEYENPVCQNEGCENPRTPQGKTKKGKTIYRSICNKCYGKILRSRPASTKKTRICATNGCDNHAQYSGTKKNGRQVFRETCGECRSGKQVDQRDIKTDAPLKYGNTVTGGGDAHHWRAKSALRYIDLESGIFSVYATSWINNKTSKGRYRNSTFALLHEQALDLFRDGDSVGEIRRKQPKLSRTKGENELLSIDGILARLVKAIVRRGTEQEKLWLKQQRRNIERAHPN